MKQISEFDISKLQDWRVEGWKSGGETSIQSSNLQSYSLHLSQNVLPNVGMIVGTSFVPALKTCFKNNTFANFRFFDFASD
jgi:hypothetical protein